MTLIARAPGKIVLSGEYAVLDGAPAISMAVDRFVETVLRPAAGTSCSVSAPAFSRSVGKFSQNAGNIEWQQGQEEFRVVDSVWRAASRANCPDYDIELDSSSFYDAATHQKLGLGSSAAVTVSLTAALCQERLCRENQRHTIASIAQRAHTNMQQGSGSGVDIATSVHGGLIEYRMDGATAQRIVWPDGLAYRVLWTGTPSSTQDKLKRLDATLSKPSRVRLANVSEDMAAAWQSGDGDRVLAAYRDYVESLREFSVDHSLGIFDAGHDELTRRAFASGLVYKPCGAGGGDIGILLGPSHALLQKFCEALPELIQVLDCARSETGFEVTVQAENTCE